MALKLVALAQNNVELNISKLTEMTPAPNLVRKNPTTQTDKKLGLKTFKIDWIFSWIHILTSYCHVSSILLLLVLEIFYIIIAT